MKEYLNVKVVANPIKEPLLMLLPSYQKLYNDFCRKHIVNNFGLNRSFFFQQFALMLKMVQFEVSHNENERFSNDLFHIHVWG
jgi:hypothetical protein